MMRFNPFADVSCKYGAPMGRQSGTLDPEKPLACRRAGRVDGDYDSGGAYWGYNGTDWIYAVWNRRAGPATCVYVRAKSRAQAMKLAVEG